MKLHFILLIAIFHLSPLFAAEKIYGTVQVDTVTSIYDGDTFRCSIKDWPPIIGSRIGIRVGGVDTPEMRDKRPHIKELARKAKQFTVQRLREGKVIELRNMKRGKYFRIVADVFIDGKNLGDELIEARLGKPYDGGKKVKWE